jgi:hypothetical protein
VSLEAEGQHRDADEEHGHHCYHLSDRSDTCHAGRQQVDIYRSWECNCVDQDSERDGGGKEVEEIKLGKGKDVKKS